MIKNTRLLKKTIIITALIALAISWRVINHNFQIAPNLELVTTVSVLAAIIVNWQAALIVPITTMILSDMIIGNSSIFVFTWSSFMIIGLGAILLRKFSQKPKSQIIYSFGFATISSLFFFVITNFGVWAQGWYPATWVGLSDCFVMAVPFYRTMLIGNMILVPASVAAYQLIKSRLVVKNLVINTLISK
jgi:hypothetical protein